MQELLFTEAVSPPPPVLDAQSVSDTEKYEVIKKTIDNFGYELSEDDTLSDDEKLREWVDILKWGVEMLPAGFEKTRELLLEGIANPRHSDYDAKWRD